MKDEIVKALPIGRRFVTINLTGIKESYDLEFIIDDNSYKYTTFDLMELIEKDQDERRD